MGAFKEMVLDMVKVTRWWRKSVMTVFSRVG